MNSKIKRIPIPKLPSGEVDRVKWLKLRNQGLGGSDVGSIMGADKYKPALKLFHQKIGLWDTDEEDNIAAYSGRVGEDHTYKKYWKYWDPENETVEAFLQNANSDTVIRKANHIHSMLVHPDYPWRIGNIDFQIQKHKGSDNGILELKRQSSPHRKI